MATPPSTPADDAETQSSTSPPVRPVRIGPIRKREPDSRLSLSLDTRLIGIVANGFDAERDTRYAYY